MALSRSSRERRKRERSVIEGCKLVRAYLDGADQPGDLPPLRDVFVAHKARNNDAIKAALRGYQGRVVALSDSLFRQASQMAESTGPIAIIDTPHGQVELGSQ